MHVGHLRSTIIGDCLARLFEALGFRVLRINHLGDWGTSFGMLIEYMDEHATDVLSGDKEPNLGALVSWYQQSKALFDKDLEFRKRSQLKVVALQSGDPRALKAWEIICDASRKDYRTIYDRLDVKLEDRGESFYNPLLAPLVQELESKGVLTLSDGAHCLFLDGFVNRDGDPFPLMVQKSDGGFNYDTTDLAALRYRIDEDRADRIIYVTDAGQGQHFAMIFAAGKKLGWLDARPIRLDHVPFGMVLGSDGKKFRTRSGKTEKLRDLLDDAIDAAKVIIRERHPDWSADEVDETGQAIGINAVKYADLSGHRVKDYMYSEERMLKFEGNTAPFLLYSLVRAKSILRRLEEKGSYSPTQAGKIFLREPSEIALGLHLLRFPEVIVSVVDELLPHHLAEYLYRLAEAFNAFFRDCRVDGSEEEFSRASLTQLTIRVLSRGLEILGLRLVERM
jgi:arginyl-tRNA synthetase